MSKAKSKITRAVKTAAKPVVTEKTLEEKYTELKSLSEALVREVDNVYTSVLQSDHKEQLLGTIVKSFSDQLNDL